MVEQINPFITQDVVQAVCQPFDIPVYIDINKVAEGENKALDVQFYVNGQFIPAALDLSDLKQWIDESKTTLQGEIKLLECERQQVQTALSKILEISAHLEIAIREAKTRKKGGDGSDNEGE